MITIISIIECNICQDCPVSHKTCIQYVNQSEPLIRRRHGSRDQKLENIIKLVPFLSAIVVCQRDSIFLHYFKNNKLKQHPMSPGSSL